jgi:hypothetical protein
VERRKKRPFTIVRRHGKMDHLPAGVKKEVNNLLLEPQVQYRDIAGFLKEKGHDVSEASVARYGRRFMEQVQRIRVAEEQARVLIAEAGGHEFLLEEAASRLFAEKFMNFLMEPDFDVTKFSYLVSDFTKLQSSSVRREKVRVDIEERVTETAEDVTKLAKARGLSDRAAADIRKKILGLAS